MKFPANEPVDAHLTLAEFIGKCSELGEPSPFYRLGKDRHADGTSGCRRLTSTDVHQALKHFKIPSPAVAEVQSSNSCHWCSLRRSNQSARLSSPSAARLARRSHLSSQSLPFQCDHCSTRSEDEPSKANHHVNEELASKNIFETISDLDRSSTLVPATPMIARDLLHELEFSLINEQEKLQLTSTDYEPATELGWKINTSDQAIDLFYDTGALTRKDKQTLLRQTIDKLQLVLNNRPTATTMIQDHDLDKIELTYGALQSTIDILTRSLDAIS